MKRIYIALLVLTFSGLQAQIHEIGVFAGGANYIGEVGKTNYINPNEPVFGFLYKWNRSPRHSYRFAFNWGKISANDLDSDVPGRQRRGNRFENSVRELAVGMEFNFFEFDLHEMDRQFTPYVFTGLTYTFYDELYTVNRETRTDKSSSTLAIPMVVGLKTNIADHWILGVEVGARYTFSDNLDGSQPKNDRYAALRYGNLESNDWYVFTGVTLTYTFGNKPCFCAD